MKKLLAIALSAIGPMFSFAQAPQQIIQTVAGGPGAGLATSLSTKPCAVATDASGNLYIADGAHCTVQKMDAAGNVTVVAGNGSSWFSGDGGLATKAGFRAVEAVAVDASGNIYITDIIASRVRKVSTSGIITTIAGTGINGYSGDNGAATAAQIHSPCGVAVDLTGNVYFADQSNQCIRKINTSGIITTVAYANYPQGVITDASGNVYFSEVVGNKVSKLSTAGVITTVAGTGYPGFSGDGGQATSAMLNNPYGIALDAAGNLYINDEFNYRIRKVNTAGIISTIAGTGITGFSGDGGTATSAQIAYVNGVAVDLSGNIYIGDRDNFRVRKINTSGTMSTVVGNGLGSFSGDGGAALNAQFQYPYATCFDASGNMYVSDWNNRIRKVTPAGIVSTIAGTGSTVWVGDNIPATTASVRAFGITADVSGNIYVADAGFNRIRKIAANGIITTIAGTGVAGFSGDGAAASLAQLNNPSDLKLDAAGNIYFSDCDNNRIRKIDVSGIITTVAGTGVAGFGGDNSAAAAALLKQPRMIAFDAGGNLYVSDEGNYRIRKISTLGIITTVAGNGTSGYGNSTGLATAAQISPVGIVVDSAGILYMTDGAYRIKKIDANGIISTFSGVDTADFQGDGGPVGLAHLNQPRGLTIGPSGAMYVADATNGRIRRIDNAVLPAINITASQNGICAGTSVQFTATAAHGGTTPVYHWTKNGSNVGTNSVTYSYAPASGDTISCVLISSDPFAYPNTIVSNTIIMNVMPVVKPTAIIVANPATNASAGQQITFSVNSSGAGANPLYQWRKNAVNITGATAATYVAVAGVDVISNDQISAWVKNTDSCGADTVSNSWTVVVLSSTGVNLGNSSSNNVEVYPNPSNGSFVISGQLSDNSLRTVTIEVCNSVGQQVYRQNIAVANGTINQKIDLQKQMTPGLYFLRIFDGDKSRNFLIEIK